MQTLNTTSRYGWLAKSLHWLVALLILTAWAVGYYATELTATNNPNLVKLFDFHKSVGMAVLMLAIIRISWRLYNIQPKMVEMNKMLIVLAHSVHYALYAFMFIQPISGWFMSSAAGYPPNFFGLFTFPDLVAKSDATAHLYKDIHNTSAYILLGLLVLHVSGAMYHHFIAKDNTLRKMTW